MNHREQNYDDNLVISLNLTQTLVKIFLFEYIMLVMFHINGLVIIPGWETLQVAIILF